MSTSKKRLRRFRTPVDLPTEITSSSIKLQLSVKENPVVSFRRSLEQSRMLSLSVPTVKSVLDEDKETENKLQLSLPNISYGRGSRILSSREKQKLTEEKRFRKKWYKLTHLWYNEKNGKVGISAQGLKQSFSPPPDSEIFIYRKYMPKVPTSVKQGDYIGSVIYRVADPSSKFHIYRNYHLYAPVSGILTDINSKLIKGNRPIIESPDDWIVRIVPDPSSDHSTDMDLLLDLTMYSLYLKRVAST